MSDTKTQSSPALWLAWNTAYNGIRFWTADPAIAAQQAGTGLVLTPFYSAAQMREACNAGYKHGAWQGQHCAQPAASGEPAVHWPQVVAYPGGNGGLGAWVDISTGDGPECVARYVAPIAQPAPRVAQPLTAEAVREMLQDTREVLDSEGPEAPQLVRDVIEYVASWIAVYADKPGIAAHPKEQQP